MKVAVIGAGAMGSLFGALLAEAGNGVCLIDIWDEHVRAINAAGLVIEKEGTCRTVALQATTDPGAVGTVELAIIFVKATHTAAAVETARSLIGEAGLVLTLQNGLGNADTIAEVVAERRVLAGTTAHGATLLGPGRIRHAGVGPTVLGTWSRYSEGSGEVQRVVEEFSRAGIETVLAEDVRQALWGKLLINVGINAITALTGIRNGQILDLPATGELSRAAVEEAVAVARACGVTVREDVAEHVLAVAAATAANRSSMGQDVDNRRLTEIGAINGAVVREARRAGLAAPVNQTLAALVETLQAHYR